MFVSPVTIRKSRVPFQKVDKVNLVPSFDACRRSLPCGSYPTRGACPRSGVWVALLWRFSDGLRAKKTKTNS